MIYYISDLHLGHENECKNLEEVRSNIDRIDDGIVKLITERTNYVKQATKFKKSERDVKAPDRVEAVIRKVREQAEKYGADADMTESLYREMISKFIGIEAREYEAKK